MQEQYRDSDSMGGGIVPVKGPAPFSQVNSFYGPAGRRVGAGESNGTSGPQESCPGRQTFNCLQLWTPS